MNFEALNSYLPSARDAVQILFFIVVGTVTVLTYIKAKRTLLQPIRTEIFKEQVKSLTALLGFFTGKSEVDLRETFGFDKLLHANACAMLDAYARMFFDLDIDDAKRPYSRSKCPTSIVSEKHLRLADDHMRLDEEKPPVKPDASVKAALWSEYDHGMIYVPKELTGIEQVLREILDSPLLPSRCVELGEAFLKTVHEDILKNRSTFTLNNHIIVSILKVG